MPGRGSILLVGAAAPELAHVAGVLGPLAQIRTTSPREGLMALARFGADVVVARDGAGQLGAHFLRQTAVLHPGAVRILLAEEGGEPLDDPDAVILPAPVDLAGLRAVCVIALRGAVAERAAREQRQENERLREVGNEALSELVEDAEGVVCYEGILPRSRAMRRVVQLLRTIEATDTTVLIHGETGTGKELAARAIHERSRRRRARFAAVNLGAISDPLRESELFGHVRGAFTGAVDSRGGLFAEANGGTVFLDEVGDASPGLQVALLRVLEEGTITPVGADRTRRVNVREAHGWEGNVRELRNVMERAAIVCRGGLIIAADLPLGASSKPPGRGEDLGATIAIPARGARLRQLEREIFLKTLALASGNQSEAARMLGLGESTFRFRLGKLGLRRTALPVSQPVARPRPAASG
ncbi:MAG: sigma-54-dependent Fis family transcriptional regulator [Deltaproteobacteria bacterium]|nr:MAG: sigma-54-dependent Fis family transcriptional regulator [Deltaproteobacteria bacterium]